MEEVGSAADRTSESSSPGSVSRRRALKAGAIGGAVAWTAPAISALTASAAHAQGGSPGPPPPPPPPPGVPVCSGCLTGGGQVLGGTYRGQDIPVTGPANNRQSDLVSSFGLSPICCDLFPGTELELVIHAPDTTEPYHFDTNLQLTCYNDPLVDPTPGPNTFTCADTYIGTIQDSEGNTLSFTLVDEGEPGNNDRVSFRIVASDGTVILVAAGTLDRGNLQAHPDLGPMKVDCDCPEPVSVP